MSQTAVLSFNQTTNPDGILNSVELSHPAVHGYQAGTVKLDFLHLGVNQLAEPKVLDGYLFGVLLFVMGGAKKLKINGALSAKAYRNANLLAEAWQAWLPERCSPVEIIAETVLDQPTLAGQNVKQLKRDRAIAAFSGGLDSTFSVLRHACHLLGNASYNVEDVLMVHGFDVSLHKQADFDELRCRVEPFLEDVGVNFRIVKTNIKDAIAHDWEKVFAAQLACVLHQFSPEFSHGLIASGAIMTKPDIRWGSTPQLDYLLSGGDFEVVHDGAGFSRTEKAALIAQYPIARRSVKVCWQGEHKGRNCGTCEKCIRTRLNFLAAGVTNPECFDSPFDLELIDKLEVKNLAQLNLLKTIIEDDKLANLGADWLARLQHRVQTLNAQFSSPSAAEATISSASSAQAGSQKPYEPATFEQKLEMQRQAIANFIGQVRPLWLLTEMPGNIGDHLIWVGTERLLKLSGLPYKHISCSGLREESQSKAGTLIIPGSGAFTARFHEWLPNLVIISSALFDRTVILPSEFDSDLPIVSEAMKLQNVYPFARDAYSYSQIKKFGKAALAFDPALWAMHFVAAQPEPLEQNNADENSKTLLALRTDHGSLLADYGFAPADNNNDISLSCQNLEEFLRTISAFNTVITDRLHVSVAAVMLGKKVQFVDPYNNKISRYIEFNFGQAFSDRLSHKTIEWLLLNQHIKAIKETQ